MGLIERQNELLSEFSMFQDDLDRFTYLTYLAGRLPEPAEGLTRPEHLVPGCQSKVWVRASIADGRIQVESYSDSALLRGMLYLLQFCINGLEPAQLCWESFTLYEKAGLNALLTDRRQSGIASVLRTVQELLNTESGTSPTGE